jgi:hypothetical protein
MTNEPAVLSNTVAVGDESAALETGARSKLADAKGEFASRSEKVAGSWGAPEEVTVGSIRVPLRRFPVVARCDGLRANPLLRLNCQEAGLEHHRRPIPRPNKPRQIPAPFVSYPAQPG